MMPSGWYATTEAWLAISRPDLTLWLRSTISSCASPVGLPVSRFANCASRAMRRVITLRQVRR
jgi:hypothetical protein